MNVTERLIDWKNRGAPYAEGVELYALSFPRRNRAGKYRSQLLRSFISPDVARQLRHELFSLIPADARVVKPVLAKARRENAASETTGEVQEALPDSVRALYRKVGRLKDQRDVLRAHLRHSGDKSPEYRLKYIKPLVHDVRPAIEACYQEIAKYRKTGVEPANPEHAEVRKTAALESWEYIRLKDRKKRLRDKMDPKDRKRYDDLHLVYGRWRRAFEEKREA